VRRIFVFAFLLGGCGEILGVTNWVVDDASIDSLGDAQNDGSPNDTTPPGDAGVCNSPREGGMAGVLVQNEFCIDTTETPYKLYDIFVNDPAVDPSKGQLPECAWDTSFAQKAPDPYVNDPQRAERPMIDINWCDAYAFCKYWGKHLCGARGDGGPLAFDAQAKTSQWYTACTNGTSQQYPYGQLYDDAACNTGTGMSSVGSLDLVGNPKTCQGGVPGLYDMSGNAQEYENDCEHTADAAADRCHFRGGTYFFMYDSVTCAAIGGGNDNVRSQVGPYNAIRCCWEP
jgi:formylglycine-generating enzyme required for sulfatase activity